MELLIVTLLRHNIAIIHQDLHEAKMYQSRLFEKCLSDPHTRARMHRGDLRGHIRDSWEYSCNGSLKSYNRFYSFHISSHSDTHALAGYGITRFVFLTGLWDNKTLNHLMKQIGNCEGISIELDSNTMVYEEVPTITNFQS